MLLHRKNKKRKERKRENSKIMQEETARKEPPEKGTHELQDSIDFLIQIITD
jgi:hypothetical protein